MFALNYLLSLFSYTVELDILGAFFKVGNLHLESLVLVLHLLQASLELEYLNHV